jgi:hypothetical protein
VAELPGGPWFHSGFSQLASALRRTLHRTLTRLAFENRAPPTPFQPFILRPEELRDRSLPRATNTPWWLLWLERTEAEVTANPIAEAAHAAARPPAYFSAASTDTGSRSTSAGVHASQLPRHGVPALGAASHTCPPIPRRSSPWSRRIEVHYPRLTPQVDPGRSAYYYAVEHAGFEAKYRERTDGDPTRSTTASTTGWTACTTSLLHQSFRAGAARRMTPPGEPEPPPHPGRGREPRAALPVGDGCRASGCRRTLDLTWGSPRPAFGELI